MAAKAVAQPSQTHEAARLEETFFDSQLGNNSSLALEHPMPPGQHAFASTEYASEEEGLPTSFSGTFPLLDLGLGSPSSKDRKRNIHSPWPYLRNYWWRGFRGRGHIAETISWEDSCALANLS